MKQLIPLFVITLILLVSCGRAKKDKMPPAPKKDSFAIQTDSQQLKELSRKYEEDARADSIRMAGVEMEALKIANKNIQARAFKKEIELSAEGLYTVKIKLAYNSFFSKNFKHLIIHMTQPSAEHAMSSGEYIYIYVKHDTGFKKVASHAEAWNTYEYDTLQDVNGDGLNDFLVNWYGSNGCCLKNFYNVYLYQPKTGTFSEGYEFINPTFSAKEKVIRGVAYGHMGDTEMYKYMWNGLQVDTLEHIYFEKNEKEEKTGKVIRKTATKEERLNQAPAEYRKIYGYDWFLGKS